MVFPEGRTTRRTCWVECCSGVMSLASDPLVGTARRDLERCRGDLRPGTLGRTPCPTSDHSSSIIVLAIVLLIFGPKRLPGLGRQLGRGMREFKDSATGKDEEPEQRDELPPAPRRRRPPTRSGVPTRRTSSPRPARFGERRED